MSPLDDGEADDGLLFVVTPLLRGETLRARADRAGGRLPVAELVTIADEVLGALGVAHAKGLVHGDLKPANIFVTSGAEVRLLDFGLASVFGASARPTRSTLEPESPASAQMRAFTAPERATGTAILDGRADVWGLGATLYGVLTGELPFALEGAHGSRSAAVRLADLARDVPSAVAGVVLRALAGDPAERWADATAMRAALLSAYAAATGAPGNTLPVIVPPKAADVWVSDVGTKVSNVEDPPASSSALAKTEESNRAAPARSGGNADDAAALARIGTLLGGKYLLEQLLGEGGTASVYRAVHRNGHRVAVKILHRHLAADGVRVAISSRGIAANRIAHPGVVRVADDAVADDGTAFLVMELLTGEPLDDHVARRGGVLSPAEVVRLSLQLLEVLAAAHAVRVVHRDIKPANLFVTTDGALRVLDFGIARVHEPDAISQTRTGAVMGTPAFMAPEQALGQTRDVDAQTDVWAVGATMVKLLTGRYVHEAPTAEAMCVYAGSRPAPSMATVAPGIDAALAAIVDRALAFDKAARWPSAASMREALVHLDASTLSTSPSTPAPTSKATRAPRATRARSRIWAVAIASVALAATLGAVRWRAEGTAARPTEPVASAPVATLPVTSGEVDEPVAPPVAGVVDPARRASTEPPLAAKSTRRAPPRAPSTAVGTPTVAAAPTPDSTDPCAPPYVTDAAGRRTYKPQCLPAGRERPAALSAEPAATDSCTPPYVVDSGGRRLYKTECLANSR